MHLVTVSAVMTSSRLYENGTTDFLGTGRRGPTLAMLAMLCSPAAVAAVVVAAEKAAAAVATGKVEAAAKEKGGRRGQQGRGGKGTNEVGGGSAAAAGGDGSSAKSTEGSALVRACYRCGKEDNLRANCTEKLCKSVQLTWAHC